MRELGSTRIIAVDLGYGNTKTANTLTPTAVIPSGEEPVFDGKILQYNGMYYRIGEGHKEFIQKKELDRDFYLMALVGIARELHACGVKPDEYGVVKADVHIVTGLPTMWVKEQREPHRSYLMQEKSVEYVYNKQRYHINLVGCTIYPQGYPAIIERLGDFHGLNLLADIGNGTMNGLYINDKRPIESMCWSGEDGVYQCITKVRDAVSKKYSNIDHDIIINQILRAKTAKAPTEYIEIVTAAARDYVKKLFQILREHKYDPEFMNLYIVGGGGTVVKNFGEYEPGSITFIDDICAAAKGYELLAYETLKKEVTR